ncbi:MAG: hypothetical protein ACPGUV_11630 [Polyangiales bacterium]
MCRRKGHRCEARLIFAPEAVRGPVGRQCVPVQVWRRAGAHDSLRRVYAGSGPYYAQRLDAWLVPVQHEGRTRLRLAYDAQGKLWVPTGQEARAHAAEARMQAEARVRELEALLAEQRTRHD